MIALSITLTRLLLRIRAGRSGAVALAALAAPAHAEDAPARVEIVMAADSEAERQLTPVIREIGERLELAVSMRDEPAIDPARIVTPPAAPAPALARVFIDVTRADVALVYLVDARWERVLVRRVQLERGLDEVAREELAQIIEASIRALAAGGRIGVTRAEASAELGVETSAPAAVAEPEPRPAALPLLPLTRSAPPAMRVAPDRRGHAPPRSAELRVGAGWGFVAWTPEVLLQGPLLSVEGYAGRTQLSWGGAFMAQYRLQRDVRTRLVGVAIQGSALRFLAHIRYRPETRFGVVAALGAGLDRERFEPLASRSESVSLGAAGSRSSAIIAATLGLDAWLGGAVWLGARGGAELDVTPDDYVLLHAGRILPIVEPLRVRPTFSTQLSWAW